MKVTIEQIKAKIKSESYLVLPDGRTTLCMLTLENGYTIKGLSACVDPAEFDLSYGRQYALQDAINQVWPLEGYLLAEKIHRTRVMSAEATPPTASPKVEAKSAKKRKGRVWTDEQRRLQAEKMKQRMAKKHALIDSAPEGGAV